MDWRDFDAKTSSGWQLYDLSKDIGERDDLAKSRPDVVRELASAWEEWNATNMAPLWHGSPTEDPTAPTKAKRP